MSNNSCLQIARTTKLVVSSCFLLRPISTTFNFLSLASPQHRPRFHNSIQVSMLKWLVRISYFPITSFKSIGKLALPSAALPCRQLFHLSCNSWFLFRIFRHRTAFSAAIPSRGAPNHDHIKKHFFLDLLLVGGDLIFFSISLFLSYF